MDFLDDPLAGILSDGSDDSFFDDDIMGKKKPVKKKNSTISQKKTALFDLEDNTQDKPISQERKDSLFNLGDDTKKVSTVESKPSLKSETKSPTPFKRAASKDSINLQANDEKFTSIKQDYTKSPSKAKFASSIGDKLDILGGEKPEKKNESVLEKGKSTQSLFLDDILGGPSTKTTGSSQPTRPTTGTKSQEFDLDAILGKKETKQTASTSKLNTQKSENVKQEIPKPKKEPAKKKASEDWLGIFQDKDGGGDAEEEEMPSWLVGKDTKKKKQEAEKKEQSDVLEPSQPSEPPQQRSILNIPQIETAIKLDPIITHVNNGDIATESATMYLQQQESQLKVALQLKAQEEKLAALQERQEDSARVQREASRAHHEHLDAMLRKQAENRMQMQAVIAAHQDRITERIKALLGPSKTLNSEGEENNEYHEEVKETPHSKEKKQLLQLVQSLQENHDKEIDLMETSYRRQLAFLEISLNQSDERMKEESDKIVKHYSEKIHWLEEHHNLFKKLAEDNLNSITEWHKNENETLRQQHLDSVRVMQEHHVSLMENLKNSVKNEQELIKDSAGFSANLIDLVSEVKASRVMCQQMAEKVTNLSENSQRDIDRSFNTRETQIQVMMEQLKKERENYETEKTENREIVKLLESRLKQMTSLMEEESLALKQKRMEFEFEKATFNKQTEFAKNVLKKQDEEIKTIKAEIEKEYQEKSAKLEEERMKSQKDSITITKEKSAVQNLKQELEKMKAELQSQLEGMNEEKSKISIDKQEIHLEEQRILAKSRDLDLLAKTAIEKQTQADKKYTEAESIQLKYEERIRRIQEHVLSLNSRERQIAKEKVSLSRERLQIHNERKAIENRPHCSLCKSSQSAPVYQNYEASYNYNDPIVNMPVSRDYEANASSAMSAIESQMAHLLGRNFGLRNSLDLNRDMNAGANVERSTHFEDHFESLQRDVVSPLKDYMDPKFMMLRMDVQRVISNLDHSHGSDGEHHEETVNEDIRKE